MNTRNRAYTVRVEPAGDGRDGSWWDGGYWTGNYSRMGNAVRCAVRMARTYGDTATITVVQFA
jgi:hypothetical protein